MCKKTLSPILYLRGLVQRIENTDNKNSPEAFDYPAIIIIGIYRMLY